MSDISLDGVRHLANLARIDIAEEELEGFADALKVIADAVMTVNKAAASDVPKTTHPMPLSNVYRDDEVGHVLDSRAVLEQAPDRDESRFKVPAILDEQ